MVTDSSDEQATAGGDEVRSVIVMLQRHMRLGVLALVDSVAWVAAMYLATALQFDTIMVTRELGLTGPGHSVPLYGVLAVAGVAMVAHLLIGWGLRLYQGRSALGSFEEIFVLANVLIAAGIITATVNIFLATPLVPRSTPVTASFIALVFCAWPRGLWRILINQSELAPRNSSATPVIIIGAGEAGRQLVQSMQRDPHHQWRPVGFVDDNKRKKHFRYRGLSVLGTTTQLTRVASHTNAGTVVVAIPSADSKTIGRINDLSLEADLDVKVLPGVNELLADVSVNAVRDLAPEDLLGRHQIETDVEAIAGYLAGKRVLVTGAGGSIGSELCRQVKRFEPAALIMLDRDESALHTLLLSMHGRADLEAPDVVLADIREPTRVREVFDDYRPEVVFHAAALKHVNMLETHAAEAVKTNVVGTLNVLEAAREFGTLRFVNISTDKAADPINVLGYTKRLAEGLTASFATGFDSTFLSVRFGNVLGTSGSVLRTFAAQVEAGGPVTVTDPEVTRYFMTVNEAVQLVIQAAAIGRDGEALVLDMGKPVRIANVARQVVDQSRHPIKIVFTGLKPGEKLHEVLFGEGEPDVRTVHPLISHVEVPTIDRADTVLLQRAGDNVHTINALSALCKAMVAENVRR